eukprot:9568802-Karenia_brevis.AAC.1
MINGLKCGTPAGGTANVDGVGPPFAPTSKPNPFDPSHGSRACSSDGPDKADTRPTDGTLVTYDMHTNFCNAASIGVDTQ